MNPGAGDRLEAIICDVDGSLVDSEPAHIAAWDAVFRAHGHFPPTADLYEPWKAKPDVAFARHVSQAYPGLGDAPALLAEKNRHFCQVVEARARGDAYLFPGVRAFLERWREEGRPLAAASNGSRLDVMGSLIHAGLTEFFPIVVTIEDVAAGKPAPDVYVEAARRLGVPPARCGALEDAALGVMAARHAGCVVAAVTNTQSAEKLRAALDETGASGSCPRGAVFSDSAVALQWLARWRPEGGVIY